MSFRFKASMKLSTTGSPITSATSSPTVVSDEIDWLEANLLRVRQAFRIHVGDHHHSCTKNARADAAAARPTGPQPAIYTVEPTARGAVSIAEPTCAVE
jgi:hypothetical protein